MGFLSKKTVTCERCGKEYQIRISLGPHICDECLYREAEKKNNVRGYVNYASKMNWPDYSEEQLDQIAAHRAEILEKHRRVDGITRAELMNVSDNYRKLSDDQAAEVLFRISKAFLSTTIGAAYTGYFFVPTEFEKTIIDADDVFAVGYTTDTKHKVDGQEVILCAVFTNDPYIPVFPMIYFGKIGFFEIMRSKKGREGVSEMFEHMCPNLTYPVQGINLLKKQLKSDGRVKGNIDLKVMLDLISDVSLGFGIFDTKEMTSDLPASSADMMDEYGYIQEDRIWEILKMDKMFNRNFWEKQIKRLSK